MNNWDRIIKGICYYAKKYEEGELSYIAEELDKYRSLIRLNSDDIENCKYFIGMRDGLTLYAMHVIRDILGEEVGLFEIH